MEDQKHISSTTKACAPFGQIAIYYGIMPKSGRSKLLVDRKKKLGRGHMFALTPFRTWESMRIESNPELDFSHGSIEILDCVHYKTGDALRFVGILEENRSPATRICIANGIAPTTLSTVDAVSHPTENKRARCENRDEDFEVMLARFTQPRKQGVDPSLKLPFIKAYTGKSHSTIYRELARGKFPPPIRHGTSVSWLLSHIDSYRLGNWKGLAGPVASVQV